MTEQIDSPLERASVTDVNQILGQKLPVLDHGFIRVVDYMGEDASIVQAARVSYGKGTKKISEDRGLINYLIRHRHTTPFEMCEIKLHVKAPIFVVRQWMRHRTANVNEYSARYSEVEDVFYVPSFENVCAQSQDNKQGRAQTPLPEETVTYIREQFAETSRAQYALYKKMLDMGVARELARGIIPLNCYTEFYWKIDLHNLFHFLKLRADPHAQLEIRVYAEKILDVVKLWVPTAFEAFSNFSLESRALSGRALSSLKKKLAGESLDIESSGMSSREWREFCQEFDLCPNP